jgi:hypothetical protein
VMARGYIIIEGVLRMIRCYNTIESGIVLDVCEILLVTSTTPNKNFTTHFYDINTNGYSTKIPYMKLIAREKRRLMEDMRESRYPITDETYHQRLTELNSIEDLVFGLMLDKTTYSGEQSIVSVYEDQSYSDLMRYKPGELPEYHDILLAKFRIFKRREEIEAMKSKIKRSREERDWTLIFK